MKMLKRTLALMLALIMMFSAVPFNAYATESTDEPSVPTEAPVDVPETEDEEPVDDETSTAFVLPRATTQTDSFTHKIVHLDNGRKHFTADWIKALITEMAADGFTQLQLAFGNDGMRFLLDDMSVTVNGTTYSSADVTAGIQAGNKAYYDDGVNELTEAEMDEIIAHAQANGIEIVPHMNMPGHMDAILDAIEHVGISNAHFTGRTTSVRSLNLNNATAVAFTKALLEKYVAYFAEKGCGYFHMGADEFGNDAYKGGMGFPNMGSTLYAKFATFVNDCAAIIKDAGMTPRAWNDGIDYGSGTDYNYLTNYSEDFDTDIQLTYWSSGWGSGYALAPASTLRGNGHSMINTNGDYYYILGVNDCYTSGTTTSHVNYDYTAAKGFNNSTFMGSTVSDPIGSMFCIWSDYPGAETETEVAMYIRPILRVMGARMQDSTSYEVDSIVAGGFNADGTINVVVTPDPEPEPDPSEPTEPTKPETPEDVTLTHEETKVEITAPGLETLTVTEAEAPVIEGAAEGKVLAWNMILATAEGNYEDAATVAVPVPEGWDASKMGAFVITDGAVELLSGALNADGKFEFTMPHFSVGGVYEIAPAAATPVEIELEIGKTHQIVIKNEDLRGTYTPDPAGVANVAVSYEQVPGETIVTLGNQITITNTNDWSADGVIKAGNYYMVVSNNGNLSATTDVAKATVFTVKRSSNSRWTIQYGDQYLNQDFSLVNSKSEWRYSGGFYYRGTDYQYYYITYSNNSWNTVKRATDKATLYSIKSAATEAVNGSTITFTGVAAGTTSVEIGGTVYNITVVAEDLSKVTTQIELWITNRAITPNDNTQYSTGTGTSTENKSYEYHYIKFAADANDKIATEEGCDISKLVAATGTGNMIYWKSTYLNLDEVERQDNAGGKDNTLKGDDFTKIRYWNYTWAYFSSESNSWVSFSDNDSYQLIAYYLQETDVTEEVTTQVVDWGPTYQQWGNGEESWFFNGSGYVRGGSYIFLDYAVVYQGGKQNPDAFPTNNTIFFHADGIATTPRVIGATYFQESNDYEIWKVTVTTGTSLNYTSQKNFTSTYDDSTETVVWDESMGGQPNVPSLTYTEKREGKLVRVYVRAKEAELKVIYYDEKFGDVLHSYYVVADSGVTFNDMNPAPSQFAGNASRLDVSNAALTNTLGVPETFETNLTKVPEAVGKYHSDLYEYTGSVISEDGKTLYLYYNINTHVLKPNFVVDFGLPITFTLGDVTNTPDLVQSVAASAKYGTVSYNPSTKTFTYTPTKVLQNVDILSITLTFDGGKSALSNVGVTPATTVYYEESFLSYSGDWTKPAAPSIHQTTEVLGEHTYIYGYDPIYAGTVSNDADDSKGSNNTQVSTTTNGDSASFTFTGTGFELYANCNEGTGYVTVTSDGQTKKMYMVDTGLNYEELEEDMPGTTDAPTGTFYNIPVISEKNLPHGTYTVTIRKTHKDNQAFEIDGVRITNTIDESNKTNADSIYVNDLEDKPVFYQLRDFVLNSIGIDGADAQQVYNDISGAKAIVTTAGVPYTDTTAQDLLNNGPKNELYLFSGQTLTFNVKTARKMQIGLKAPNGATDYAVTCTGTNGFNGTMATSVDMFYDLGNSRGTETTYTVTVKNTGSNILAVTDLKICDDPNFGFVALTEDDIAKVLGVEETPVEPEVPETTEPEVPETTEPAKPTKPTEPTKPTKPTKPTEPQKPTKPGNNGNNKPGKEEKTYTLKITFVNLLGKKVGTATITTTNGVVSAYEIVGKAPAGRMAIWLIPVTLRANGNTSIVVPVI